MDDNDNKARRPDTGKQLKIIRKANGLTQEQLGDKLGVCRKTITVWERTGIPEKGFAKTKNIMKLLGGSGWQNGHTSA